MDPLSDIGRPRLNGLYVRRVFYCSITYIYVLCTLQVHIIITSYLYLLRENPRRLMFYEIYDYIITIGVSAVHIMCIYSVKLCSRKVQTIYIQPAIAGDRARSIIGRLRAL